MTSLSTIRRGPVTLAVSTAVLGFALWGCGGDDAAEPTLSSIAASEPAPETAPATTGAPIATTVAATSTAAATSTSAPTTSTSAAPIEPLAIDESSFKALRDMTPIRGFFVDSLVGDLDGTVEAANAIEGAVYPFGSVVQLIPGEVMVKREPGFSETTKDWEFFELDVNETGSVIRVRGGDEVVNRFGGSCAQCHELADPAFDFVCEQDHGCEPLPFDRAAIEAIQQSDPRPQKT